MGKLGKCLSCIIFSFPQEKRSIYRAALLRTYSLDAWYIWATTKRHKYSFVLFASNLFFHSEFPLWQCRMGGFPFEFLLIFDFRRCFLNGILVTHYCILLAHWKFIKVSEKVNGWAWKCYMLSIKTIFMKIHVAKKHCRKYTISLRPICSSIKQNTCCRTCIFFRAHLLFAIFAIWTPFAKNTWSRNFQYRFF